MIHAPSVLNLALRAKAERLTGALNVLAGPDAPVTAEVAALSERYRWEWQRLSSQRVEGVTVALTGPVNAGKSFLARLVVGPPHHEAIPCGESVSRATLKLRWIGPHPPATLDPEREEFLPVPAEALGTLGVGCTLLDTPGSDDTDPQREEFARAALQEAELKVVVIPSALRRDAALRDHLHAADGAVLLPVVHLSAAESSRWNDASLRAAIEEDLAQLRTSLPQAHWLDTVLLPDLEAGFSEADLRAIFLPVLQEALRHPGTLRAGRWRQLQASAARHEAAVRDLLSRHLPELARADAALDQVLRTLPRRCVEDLLRDTAPLRTLLRGEHKRELLERVPPWLFPFRTVTGLLCLAAGAWDRLVLAASGSLPSLLSGGWTAARRWRDEHAARQDLAGRAQERFAGVVQAALAEPLDDFEAAVRRLRPEDFKETPEAGPAFRVRGVEGLARLWREALEGALRETRVPRTLPLLVGLAAFAAFWFILGAPLLQLYGQYLPAAWAAWRGQWAVASLESWPAVPPGFWFTAFLLGLLPLTLMAMAVVAGALSPARIRRTEARLRERLLAVVEHGQIDFAVELAIPAVSAARELLQLCRSDPAPAFAAQAPAAPAKHPPGQD